LSPSSSQEAMDPDRVRAYLQVACAGLGFDIGEIWWTSNSDGGSSSALAAIGKRSFFLLPKFWLEVIVKRGYIVGIAKGIAVLIILIGQIESFLMSAHFFIK
jgi:hypothetical protein